MELNFHDASHKFEQEAALVRLSENKENKNNDTSNTCPTNDGRKCIQQLATCIVDKLFQQQNNYNSVNEENDSTTKRSASESCQMALAMMEINTMTSSNTSIALDEEGAQDYLFLNSNYSSGSTTSSSSTELPPIAEFMMFHGAFFAGALLSTIGAALELKAALKHRLDPPDVFVRGQVGEDDETQEWIYHPVLWGWDVLKTFSVAATLMFLVSSLAEIYLKQRQSCLGWVRVLLFGTAATLDLLSSLWDDNVDDSNSQRDLVLSQYSYLFGNMSTDIYLASAMFEMAANHKKYPFAGIQLDSSFTLAADLLFLGGATIDAVVARLDNPNESNQTWFILTICAVVSSVCWLLNCLLNTATDILAARHSNEDHDHVPLPLEEGDLSELSLSQDQALTSTEQCDP
ncbi:hypothetical protein ACA910_010490 [Epithemia clementina (nom. ined.)]